jgi:high-affinity iron transporter
MKLFFVGCLLLLPIEFSSALAFAVEQSPRALVHILDYLAQDYSGAVSNHKIINSSEFHEQEEFARRAVELNPTLPQTQAYPEIQTDLTTLQALIHSASEPEKVSSLAQKIKTQVIEVTHLEVAPTKLPNLKHGASLFEKNCVSCHGLSGHGDGLLAKGLKPPPANFWEQTRMDQLSPFKAFNAIRIGVPGTAMASYPTFSDKEAWELAFYVLSLRYENVQSNNKLSEKEKSFLEEKIPLKTLATVSDGELKQKLNLASLIYLRTHSENDDYQNPLILAREYLQQALDSYKKGDLNLARTKALMAYLEGVEPVEPKLKASDPTAMSNLEQQMSLVRTSIDEHKSYDQVLGSVNSARSQIDMADTIINQAPASPTLTFTVAAAIILREGFEAVLIIIALLGVLRASGAKSASRWIHGGWILALFSGALFWIFSGWLIGISGAQRELIEAITSIGAVLILLYMGFWLHSKTESGRWRIFINDRVKAALQKKNLLGLGIISFTAVFREAFETVLFLRALWIEGGLASKTAMVSGVLSSLAFVLLFSWLLLKYSARIPIKKLFDFSSTLMGILAIILIGKGIHSLQETGYISITQISLGFHSDLIGVFPTLETWLSQIGVLIISLGLWFYGRRPSPAPRPQDHLLRL